VTSITCNFTFHVQYAWTKRTLYFSLLQLLYASDDKERWIAVITVKYYRYSLLILIFSRLNYKIVFCSGIIIIIIIIINSMELSPCWESASLHLGLLSLYAPGESSAAGAYDWQPYLHLWADCLDTVQSSTSHNPIGLHGRLRIDLHFFTFLASCAATQFLGSSPCSQEPSLLLLFTYYINCLVAVIYVRFASFHSLCSVCNLPSVRPVSIVSTVRIELHCLLSLLFSFH
jgi:hypothetical protein